MIEKHRSLTLLLAAVAALACSESGTPSEPVTRSAPTGPLREVIVSGPEAVPLEEGESLPPGFTTAAKIISKTLDLGFAEKFAYGTASMEYWATHGTLDLRLKLWMGTKLIDTTSGFAHRDELIPGTYDIVARATLSLPARCGLRLDGKLSASTWFGFPAPKSGSLFTWGHVTEPSSGVAEQEECIPQDDDDGSLDEGDESEPYEGSCEICQEWIVIINDSFAGSYWECWETDPSECGFGSNNG